MCPGQVAIYCRTFSLSTRAATTLTSLPYLLQSPVRLQSTRRAPKTEFVIIICLDALSAKTLCFAIDLHFVASVLVSTALGLHTVTLMLPLSYHRRLTSNACQSIGRPLSA